MTPRRLPRAARLAAGLWLTALGLAVTWPPAPASAQQVEVANIILSERELGAGDTQIVQVELANAGEATARIGVQVELRGPEGARVGPRRRKTLSVDAYDRRRAYFQVPAPGRGGEFQVHVRLYTPDFGQRLHEAEPGFYATFTVRGAPPVAAAKPDRPAGPQQPAPPQPPGASPRSFPAPEGLSFEAPDLTWERFDASPAQVLPGDTGTLRAELRNVGGDIARDITVSADSFNTRIPDRVRQLTSTEVAALAPGEKIELELEYQLPEDALLGEYRLVLEARLGGGATDGDPENNRITLERPVRLTRIRLVFPGPGYSFEETGLFLFRWESRLYEEYKVQLGVDPNFENEDLFFDIPQGEKWTQDQEVVPLGGELPGMATSLMRREDARRIHWRVMGRDPESDRRGYSPVRSFTIQRQVSEEPPPEETAPPRPRRTGPAQPPAAPEGEGQAPPAPPEGGMAPGGGRTAPEGEMAPGGEPPSGEAGGEMAPGGEPPSGEAGEETGPGGEPPSGEAGEETGPGGEPPSGEAGSGQAVPPGAGQLPPVEQSSPGSTQPSVTPPGAPPSN